MEPNGRLQQRHPLHIKARVVDPFFFCQSKPILRKHDVNAHEKTITYIQQSLFLKQTLEEIFAVFLFSFSHLYRFFFSCLCVVVVVFLDTCRGSTFTKQPL